MPSLEEARNTLYEALGGPRIDVRQPPLPQGRRETIVLCSDLHAPWTRLDLVGRVLKEPADRAMIIGDIDDGYEASRYPKRRVAPLLDSWAQSKAVLEAFASTYPLVDVIEGNHDTRLSKVVTAAFKEQPGLVEAIRQLAGGSLSPLKALARDLPNVTVRGTQVGQFNVDWFYQYGDLLIVHAEAFSSTPASAVRKVGDWFRRMQKQLGLKPWRVLVQAHTHQLSYLPYDDDRLLLECGCLAQTQEYQLDPKLGGLPQRLGYIVLSMEDGRVDIPSVRPVWLE